MAVRWTLVGIGFWLTVSPWVLGFSSISVMKWNNIIVGVALVIVNVWKIFGGKDEPLL